MATSTMRHTNFMSWWEEHPEAVHALAAMFRLKNTTNFPLPSVEWNIPVDQSCTTLEGRISWQNQNPDINMTASEPGEQVWFVKGETLGVVLIELDQNFTEKEFGYQLMQAGAPTPTNLPAAIGTGRIMFSHALSTQNYQPHTAVEIAGVGPLGERTLYMDGGRITSATNKQTTLSITVVGTVNNTDNALLNVVSATGGAWRAQGQPGTGFTGGQGFINLTAGTNQTFVFLISLGDDYSFFITGVDGECLDAGFNVQYNGRCATWRHWPANGFWRKVADYQNVLVAGVNFTLRNPNNDLAVPSATDILIAKLRNPYHGWFIRQAMLGTTAFEYISSNFDENQYKTGIYGKGVTVALLPLDTSAYNSFTQMSTANPDGSAGITDVSYNLQGGGPGGAMRMEEACIVVDCTVVANAESNQGCNAERQCTVRACYYGNDPTDQARKATMDPLIYKEVNFYCGFYPLYERLDENGELPTVLSLLETLRDSFLLNYVAPPDLLNIGGNRFDGGGLEEKVNKQPAKKGRVAKASTLDKAAAMLDGRQNAF